MGRKVIPGGLYRHYKKNWYFVIGAAQHTESREEFVTYFPLYLDEPRLFIRPKEMFLEKVDPKKSNGLQAWRFLEGDACGLTLDERKALLNKAEVLLGLMGLSIVEE